MRHLLRATFLGGILGALALVPSLHQSETAQANSTMHTHIFPVLVKSDPLIPPVGTPVQSYINGEPCGHGEVVKKWYTGDAQVSWWVPSSCAWPGAPVEFIVAGYSLHDRGGWGVNLTFPVEDGVGSTAIVSRLATGPAGRWMGTVHNAAPGSLVEARINGKTCGTALTFALPTRTRVLSSGYDLKVMPAHPEPYGMPYCGFDGAKVDFFVNGQKVSQYGVWSTGPHVQDLMP